MGRKQKEDRPKIAEFIKQNLRLTLENTSKAAKLYCKQNNIFYDDPFRRYFSRVKHETVGENQKIIPRPLPNNTDKSVSAKREEKQGWEETEEVAAWNYTGKKSLTTLEDALKYCKADMKKWDVDRWVFNSWDVTSKEGVSTNYQVKIWFKIKDKSEELAEAFRTKIEKYLKNRQQKPRIHKAKTREKVGVVPIADIHLGAYIRDLILTKNYDIKIATNLLDEVADEINSMGYSKVHIAIIGDVIESFTGKNHPNSFQSIGYNQTGFSIFTTAYEILESFLSRIRNLEAVYCVSGNHDRYSSDNKEDVKGEVLQGLAYFLNKELPIPVKYHPLIINEVIDGISYLFTHGHHRFTNQNLEKIILDYGVQGIYNLVIQGHDHTRKKKEVLVKTETIIKDTSKYRGYVCPSLFTGNFYSESNGWSSTPGFLQFWNKNGIPGCLDLPLG
jgi:predicted phosphodiesterase